MGRVSVDVMIKPTPDNIVSTATGSTSIASMAVSIAAGCGPVTVLGPRALRAGNLSSSPLPPRSLPLPLLDISSSLTSPTCLKHTIPSVTHRMKLFHCQLMWNTKKFNQLNTVLSIDWLIYCMTAAEWINRLIQLKEISRFSCLANQSINWLISEETTDWLIDWLHWKESKGSRKILHFLKESILLSFITVNHKLGLAHVHRGRGHWSDARGATAGMSQDEGITEAHILLLKNGRCVVLFAASKVQNLKEKTREKNRCKHGKKSCPQREIDLQEIPA